MTEDRKERQRDHYRAPDPAEGPLTTDQGVAVDHTDDSLTVGERGPTLMEDFHFREKLTHFDHERIPERVVHARGAGAYGYFEPYESCAEFTRAAFLQDPSVRTPVFVRFSTVQGPRGSADTVRDVRGFATKFYTSEGNYDLVGNNMPVFFIQDGIKFPDFVHALKPEPQNDIPTGASAHDTLWDFVSLQPETMHMMMWLMSDRAIPRSFRMMQGFGVHTFRFVDAQGRGTFVKFHWKPKLGVHSLVWDEAQEAAGRDPDFNRRDLWEAIEAGQYPEYELGVQLIPEEDEFNFDFDLLDATKIVPEEQVPVRPIGHMVLNRNPDNFFAETEQVAFHTGNVVPGIDFTNDPLLQARNFSYLDTQLIRLGGPNFSQLPVNRPVTPARTNHRDGYHQTMLHKGTNYSPNSLGGGCPALAGADGYAFSHYAERVEGHKIRKRSESFKDFYSQAALFWNSMSAWEKRHIVDAFRFELGKVAAVHVRERTVEQLAQIDYDLASQVAQGIGVAMPEPGANNHKPQASPALSQENLQGDGSIRTRQIAVLVTDGVDTAQLTQAPGGTHRPGRRRRGPRPARRQGGRRRRQRLRGRPRPPHGRLRPLRRRPPPRRPHRHPRPGLRQRGHALRPRRLPPRQTHRRPRLGRRHPLLPRPGGPPHRLRSRPRLRRPRRGHGHDDGHGERGIHQGLHRSDSGPPALGPPADPLLNSAARGRR